MFSESVFGMGLVWGLGAGYKASDKSQITNNKSGTLGRTGRAILHNPYEESDSLRLQIIWHASERVKFLENVTNWDSL